MAKRDCPLVELDAADHDLPAAFVRWIGSHWVTFFLQPSDDFMKGADQFLSGAGSENEDVQLEFSRLARALERLIYKLRDNLLPEVPPLVATPVEIRFV